MNLFDLRRWLKYSSLSMHVFMQCLRKINTVEEIITESQKNKENKIKQPNY